MQPNRFTYDQLTPLEQCIVDFMAVQEQRNKQTKKKREVAKASKPN